MKRLLIGTALAALAMGTAGAEAGYKIGVSNSVQGNGWREEMICAVKAEALASGKVDSLNIAHRNTDAAGQLEDMRNLIQAGVNAIVVDSINADGINAAIKEATGKGIVVVAVDQAVSEPSAYILSNDQTQYAYLGAKWLFEKLGGKGAVVYMRGAAGAGADNDRDKGFKRALAEYPGITIAKEVFTGWQQDQGKQQINDIIASGMKFDGVWTSGIDDVVVDAFTESGRPLVPIVGADTAGFVTQLLKVEGLKGAAVTNPGSVGGAGVALAIQILDGKKPAGQTVLVNPVVWDNTTEAGRALITASENPNLNPEWPVSVTIPGWTHYSPEQIIACKGPGK